MTRNRMYMPIVFYSFEYGPGRYLRFWDNIKGNEKTSAKQIFANRFLSIYKIKKTFKCWCLRVAVLNSSTIIRNKKDNNLFYHYYSTKIWLFLRILLLPENICMQERFQRILLPFNIFSYYIRNFTQWVSFRQRTHR